MNINRVSCSIMPIMRWFIEINAARMKHYFSFGAKKAMFPGNGVKLDLLSRLRPIQIYGPAYYHRHFVSHAVKKGELSVECEFDCSTRVRSFVLCIFVSLKKRLYMYIQIFTDDFFFKFIYFLHFHPIYSNI